MRELEELLEKVDKKYQDKSNKHYIKICAALEFAKKAHEGQKRQSGEDYIIHPCAVASILMDLGMDYKTIIAALLHDVLEDTPHTAQEIEALFGPEVVALVNGVTKLNKLRFKSKEEEQAENFKKLFFAMANDIRVIIIKLSDRVHNLRTIDYLSEERRLAIAQESLDIYAPIAGRLGISNIKCEIEDRSMAILYPQEYKEITSALALKSKERENFIKKVTAEISLILNELNIEGEISGRPKHIYSIFKKMKRQNKTLDQIYDLIAVRIITDTIKDCYALLGAVHSKWKPLPGRFKDYIAMPKPNLYQSLHTTVISEFSAPFEIQIRTYEMHKVAEYGIAAHWKYKEGKTSVDNLDNKFNWIREVMSIEQEYEDSEEFLNLLKIDFFNDEVFVFTPKGDVVNLPIGSNGIDFAYSVHSEVGNKCVGIKINSKIVPITTKLNTGDIVEVITSNVQKGPSRDWLKYAVTSNAKSKIKQFFKKVMKEENIKRGMESLEREFKHRSLKQNDLMRENWLDYILKRYSMTNMDDLYAAIGYGELNASTIVSKLYEFYRKENESKNPKKTEQSGLKARRSSSGVLVKGYDDFLIRLSRCCNPVPGDNIIGYISRGRGVTIHRRDCVNVKAFEPERLIEAEWSNMEEGCFVVSLQLFGENRSGILADVAAVINSLKHPITNVNAKIEKENKVNIIVSVEIKNTDELDELLKKLSGIKGVFEVVRTNN